MTILPDDYPPAILANLPPESFGQCYSPKGVEAGLWLYHKDLDRAHAIAQSLNTPEGSFWHGIMHRLEPDPWNAKYWFRQVGRHPIFPALRNQAKEAGYAVCEEWDPFAWIDYWESARQRPGSGEYRIAVEVERAEWTLLFDYCSRLNR